MVDSAFLLKSAFNNVRVVLKWKNEEICCFIWLCFVDLRGFVDGGAVFMDVERFVYAGFTGFFGSSGFGA